MNNQRTLGEVINLTQESRWGRCQRCIKSREAQYRVFTDAMEMKVCASCADEAGRLGIFVEALEPILGSARRIRSSA